MTYKLLPFEQAVIAERKLQELKWGRQRHELPVWVTVLTEEVGEVAEAVLEFTWQKNSLLDVRKELIQVAAVCRAMVEQIDEDLRLPKGQATCWPPGEAQ